MTPEAAIVLLQAAERGRAERWRMRSPFYRAALRASWREVGLHRHRSQ